MRKINKIIIHCSDTYVDQDIGVEDIRRWHRARGFRDVGYHYVIRRDGELEKGRKLDEIGAHCLGQNKNSIGICLVGGKEGHGSPADNFTIPQIQIARMLISDLRKKFDLTIHGHNEFANKACPVIDIKKLI